MRHIGIDLDGVFGELLYQDVTAPKALIVEAGVSG